VSIGPHENFRLFGRVCATPIDLPELERARNRCADFRVALGVVDPPEHEHSTDSEEHDGAEWLALWDRATDVVFRYPKFARFHCDVSGPAAQIVVDALPDVPAPTIRHLLIDDVIPHVIARSGAPVLHGAGVAVDGQALVILGDSAAGKSTLSVALAQAAGVALIGDDCVVVDSTPGGFVAPPSYPTVRLSPRTARALLGDDARGKPYTHYSNKLRFSDGITFTTEAVPVRGVVRLERAHARLPAGAAITTFRGHAACASLIHGLRFSPRTSRAKTVRHVTELTEQARVGQVTIDHDLNALPDVCRVLLEWFHSGH
jgi:hypothetical protein